MTDVRVRRVDFGYFVRPGSETETGRPHGEPCLGYLIDLSDGALLVDTGMGSHPDVEAHYRPRRNKLHAALSVLGTTIDDVRWVANCHLHFDHCGGNPLLPGRPVFTQRVELETARTAENYTLPELVDAPGVSYELIDGEAEILPGVIVIPTPGHTAGHQSVVVRCPDGTVIVAGQCHDTATAYARDTLGWRAGRDGHTHQLEADVAAWIGRLQQFDPARVVFAHDHSEWRL
jgi:N-acyl homoserine lactone hydrolase